MSNSSNNESNQSTQLAQTFLVGGAVRDQLLGRPVIEKDWLVVGSTVEKMLADGYQQVGKDFPVFLHPKTKDEYALARTERKLGTGYTGFVCYAEPDVTIEQDLYRRDLTINAMAQDSEGNIIDPYNGQTDLANKILRHVSDAFVEDPLRVLRVARFAARYAYLEFTVAEETLQLMTKIVSQGEIQHLIAERVWKEFSRALCEQNPEVFIEILRDTGALSIIWSSLAELWGVPNPKQHHPEICSGVHTMLVLKQAVLLTSNDDSNQLGIRFAALCHDLGKTLTPDSNLPSHYGHEKSGLALVETICQQLKVPNNVKRLALLVCEYHLHCHKAFELKASTILKMFNAIDIWRRPEDLEDFLLCCEADAKGRQGLENQPYEQANYLRKAAEVCNAVNAKPFVAQGLTGVAIKDAMHQARVSAVKQINK